MFNSQLMFAEQAIDYVHNTIKVKPTNRSEGINIARASVDREALVGQYDKLTDRQGTLYDQMLDKHHKRSSMTLWYDSAAETMKEAHTAAGHCENAQDTAKFGAVGNCFEQVSIAQQYLKSRGVFSLGLYGFASGLNHAFLVICRSAPPNQTLIEVGAEKCPKEWEGGIYCDPWAHQCFEINQSWSRRISTILQDLNHGIRFSQGTRLRVELRRYIT
ncbi:Uncharacterised protein [BD1-7 clade bacterium]|uniref:Uncharacterized protein n=1 Tax=BD1-7 clade bacterium TaxID=2029982 RepID=A0A5S9QVW0_9GAMM|nr:Uncharacterised protein [BD1-7 clade bacterium]